MKVLLLTLIISLASLAQQAADVEKRFDVPMPPTADVVSMAISPDGQKVVFVSTSDGRQQLWVRDLNSDSTRKLKGTEDVSLPYPFWSPDSKTVGYFMGDEIRRIDIETEKQQVVTTNFLGRGGTWGKDHTILFATTGLVGILRVSDTGGTVSRVTQVAPPRQSQHLFPSFLPDGRHFLYYVVGTADASGVYVGQIDGSPGKKLLSADSAAVYATSGQIFYARQGKLLAQNFDPVALNTIGEPFQVAEKISITDQLAAVSASTSGLVAYRTETAERQFAWFDRSGKKLGAVGGPTSITSTAMSRDGSRVAFGRTVDGNVDIWFLDPGSGAFSRITNSPGFDGFPAFSPDGHRMAFASTRNGVYEIYEKRAPFDGLDSIMLPITQVTPLDWSPDGRYLLLRRPQSATITTFLAAPIDGSAVMTVATALANSTINHAQFSPDGKWLSFSSNRSGREEIHIAPFSPGSAFQPSAPVSSNGGTWSRWARDGKELFYVAPDGMLMAVPFDTATGQTKAPVRLFAPPMYSSVGSQYSQQYLVGTDGRFLVITAEEVQSPIHVIANLQPKR